MNDFPRLPPDDPSQREPTRPLSILSLRATSQTERPDAVAIEDSSTTTQEPHFRRFRHYVAVAVGSWIAMAGLLLAWRSLGDQPDSQSPNVLSGVARPHYSQTGQALRWRKPEIVIAIDSSVDKLGPGAREAIQGAFGSWLASDATLPALRFDSTQNTKPSQRPDGVNAVMVAPIDIPGHREDLAITLTFSDVETGEIIEADLVINSRHQFGVLGASADDSKVPEDKQREDRDDDDRGSAQDDDPDNQRRVEACNKRYDLQNAATHEAGHFFGLGEDVEEQQTTMYQSIQRCEVQKRTLEGGDRTAIADLYLGGLDNGSEEAAQGCAVSSEAPRRTHLSWPAALLILGALARRRPWLRVSRQS